MYIYIHIESQWRHTEFQCPIVACYYYFNYLPDCPGNKNFSLNDFIKQFNFIVRLWNSVDYDCMIVVVYCHLICGLSSCWLLGVTNFCLHFWLSKEQGADTFQFYISTFLTCTSLGCWPTASSVVCLCFLTVWRS